MRHLFSPFQFSSISLKNRIVLPPLASFLFTDKGAVAPRAVEHYRRRAAGGPAMVIMEACAVSPEGVVSPFQPRIDSDRYIEGLYRIAEAIKSEGAVAACQIHHAGRQTSARVIGRKPLAPSPLPCATIRGDVAPMSLAMIESMVDKFAAAAVRVREAGFELLEVHGAHGYLINQFLSGYSNIRTDRYGQNLAGRARFALEIVTEIRNRVGPRYPLSFKISAQEFVPKGLTLADSTSILRRLVEAGIDIVQVSAGNDATPEWICQPMLMQKGCLADSAGIIRQTVGIPTMAVGRINDPLTAERIIESGKADLTCIGRGLMADPELPIKAREGRLEEICYCIACNTCMQSIFRLGRLECLVNPALCREKEMEIVPAKNPKKIMVVGGGPGGLNTAWVAAQRGHVVHLYEKQPFLGGQLIPGSQTAYKTEMRSLIRFQKKQADLNGVKCHLSFDVTADTVKALNPDAVVLATGSRPILPAVEGIESQHVCTFDVALNGSLTDRVETVIIGGGATGCEVAYHISDNASSVTIVEMAGRIGGDLESVTKRVLLRRLQKKQVKVLTGHKLVRIEPSAVLLEKSDGNQIRQRAKRVIIAIGIAAENSIHQKIKSLGYETHVIGDCLEPRTAKTAIYEGAVLGRKL